MGCVLVYQWKFLTQSLDDWLWYFILAAVVQLLFISILSIFRFNKKKRCFFKGHSKTKVWLTNTCTESIKQKFIIIFTRLRTKKCSHSIIKQLYAVHWCYFRRIKYTLISLHPFLRTNTYHEWVVFFFFFN